MTDLNDPPVHVPGVEEDGVEVCEGGEEAAVVRHVAVGDGAARRHEGVVPEPEPGHTTVTRYQLGQGQDTH